MRGTLVVAILSLLLGGTAYAGRGHGKHKHKHSTVVVRDHRSGPSTVVVRDHRGPKHHKHKHKHVKVAKGRYVFPGGVVRVYKKPVVARYYDVNVRPAIIVESYDPVPGYVWVQGSWHWGGGEWIWTPGYWAVADEPVVVGGGVNISAGITIR